MVELRHIGYALELARHRNFSRAAEALQVTQPSLTRAIATLEKSLGLPLFDRTRKGVIPTSFGRLLLERGEAMVRSEAALQRELQLLAGVEQGTLAIAAGPYSSEISVAEAVARLATARPRLRISCLTQSPEQVFRELLAERVDIGVATAEGWEGDPRFVVEALPPQRLYFACRPGHPLTLAGKQPLARLLEFPMVSVALRRDQVAATFAPAPTGAELKAIEDFVPQILINSLAMARRIARRSDALTFGTAGQLAEDVAAGRLVRLDHEGPLLQTGYGIVYLRERSLSPAARAFLEALRAVEAEGRLADPIAWPA